MRRIGNWLVVLVGPLVGCSATDGGTGTRGTGTGGTAAITTGGSFQAAGAASITGGSSSTLGGSSSSNGGAPSSTGGSSSTTGGVPSGTGGTSTPGSGAPGTGGNVVVVVPVAGSDSGGAASCGVQTFMRERKPAEVILVLDRSQSMEDPPEDGTMRKWDIVEPALLGVVEATNSGISWGLKLYPESQDTDACAPETIVDTIHVPIAPNNGATVNAAITTADPLGDGTPTGAAITYAAAHLTSLAATSDNPKYILLATDGDPSCDETGDEDSDGAATYAVSAITGALEDGFPTFVIGVDTTKDSSVERLNAMANAGGRPRPPESQNPLAIQTSFYLASTQAELTQALQEITGEVGSCVFDLTPPPPVPDNIAIDFNGMRTERDPTRMNGWEYTGDGYTSVEVYGTWCDLIKTQAMNQVEIKYGCPNQPIPEPE